jgi:hypothetical protein
VSALPELSDRAVHQDARSNFIGGRFLQSLPSIFFQSGNPDMDEEEFQRRLAAIKASIDRIRANKYEPPTIHQVAANIGWDRAIAKQCTRRREFAALTQDHIAWIPEIALMRDYDRAKVHAWMIEHYSELFPPLRWRVKERDVPADDFRRSMMISRLLDEAEQRRAETPEWARQEAHAIWDRVPKSQRAKLLPPGY